MKKNMEHDKETFSPFDRVMRVHRVYRLVENQIEKNIESEMQAWTCRG